MYAWSEATLWASTISVQRQAITDEHHQLRWVVLLHALREILLSINNRLRENYVINVTHGASGSVTLAIQKHQGHNVRVLEDFSVAA